MKRRRAIGIDIQRNQLTIAQYRSESIPQIYRVPYLGDISTWPDCLWTEPMALSDSLSKSLVLKRYYHTHVAISLPLACIKSTLVTLPNGSLAHDSALVRQMCQHNGVDFSTNWSIQIKWICPDIRRSGYSLCQVTGVPKQLIGVLVALAQQWHWHIDRIDLGCFMRAYRWWQCQPVAWGRYAYAYLAHSDSHFEVSLFYLKRLLDWRLFQCDDPYAFDDYMLQLQILWQRLPGVRMAQLRLLSSLKQQFSSPLSHHYSVQNFALDECPDDGCLAAVGGLNSVL